MTIKELREKRGSIWEQMKLLNKKSQDEKRGFAAEEQQSWDRMNAELDDLARQITVAEQAEAREREFAERVNPGVGRADTAGNGSGEEVPSQERAEAAFSKFLRWGTEALAAEERALLRPAGATEGRSLRGSEIEVRVRQHRLGPEFRGQTVGTGSAGGFTVPEGFVNAWEFAQKAFGGMREASRILPTDSGNDLPYPTANDTDNVGEIVAEEASIGSHVGVTVGQVILKAYKYSSKLVQVSRELLEDSAFDVAAEVGRMLGERIGRITNTHFTTGDNASKPQGVVTGAVSAFTAASATAITVDELIRLFHSVDRAYRMGPNVFWMFNDSTLEAIRKLTKADWAVPVWQPGLAAGEPDRILGKPYIVNNDVAAIATGAKSVLFGDFSKYLIRDVAAFRLRRLEELYAANDQVGFIAFMRHDGRLLDAGTAPIKFITQA